MLDQLLLACKLAESVSDYSQVKTELCRPNEIELKRYQQNSKNSKTYEPYGLRNADGCCYLTSTLQLIRILHRRIARSPAAAITGKSDPLWTVFVDWTNSIEKNRNVPIFVYSSDSDEESDSFTTDPIRNKLMELYPDWFGRRVRSAFSIMKCSITADRGSNPLIALWSMLQSLQANATLKKAENPCALTYAIEKDKKLVAAHTHMLGMSIDRDEKVRSAKLNWHALSSQKQWIPIERCRMTRYPQIACIAIIPHDSESLLDHYIPDYKKHANRYLKEEWNLEAQLNPSGRRASEPDHMYQLLGVLFSDGRTSKRTSKFESQVDALHAFSCIRSGDLWYECDNERITKIDWESITNIAQLDHVAPMILMYEAVTRQKTQQSASASPASSPLQLALQMPLVASQPLSEKI